jgi:hypothetical protein
MAMPAIVFDDQITLDLGSHDRAHLLRQNSHARHHHRLTAKKKILFVADLLFVELHPTADGRSGGQLAARPEESCQLVAG